MRKIILILALIAISAMTQNAFAKADADYDKALGYYNKGKYQEAIKLFKEYTQKTPDPAAYYRIGYALYKLGKFEEANEYFKESYLLSPTFSPEKIGDYEKYQLQRRKSDAKTEAAVEMKAPGQGKESPVAATHPPVPSAVPQPQVAQVPAPPPAAKQPATAPKVQAPTQPGAVKVPATPEATKAPAPPVMMPPKPMVMPKDMPEGVAGIFSAIAAGFAMAFLVIGLVIYLFFAFCLFKIAKKLDVPAAWTAFIPIVQIWTQVACAGKPWWWILLLLVPIVGFFLYIYLWMCISENLGRNRWLGLLILVPLVNLGFIAWLAFSGGGRESSPGEIPETE